MIAYHRDQSSLENPSSLELREDAANDGVGVGNLASVRVLSIAATVRLRRCVGGVRIVQMNPDEKRRGMDPEQGNGKQFCQALQANELTSIRK